jgi:hypothetical protein
LLDPQHFYYALLTFYRVLEQSSITLLIFYYALPASCYAQLKSCFVRQGIVPLLHVVCESLYRFRYILKLFRPSPSNGFLNNFLKPTSINRCTHYYTHTAEAPFKTISMLREYLILSLYLSLTISERLLVCREREDVCGKKFLAFVRHVREKYCYQLIASAKPSSTASNS